MRIGLVLVAVMLATWMDASAAHAAPDAEESSRSTRFESILRDVRLLGKEAWNAEHEVKFGGTGRIGGTVGHVAEVPYAYAFPGGAMQLRYRMTLGKRIFLGADAGGSLGVGEDGQPLGGYRVMGFLGATYLRSRFLTLQLDGHAGLSSYSLIPLPRAGMGHTITVTPIDFRFVTWDFQLVTNGDVSVLMPSVSATLCTALTLKLWKLFAGLEAGASGEVLIAAVANSASGALYARGFAGVVF